MEDYRATFLRDLAKLHLVQDQWMEMKIVFKVASDGEVRVDENSLKRLPQKVCP